MHSLTKNGKTKKTLIGLVAVLSTVLFAASDCEEDKPSSGASSESKTRTSNYDKIVKNQPAHTMEYSPTRATKNFWIDTWGEKGKVSYVYLMNSQSVVFGYFILEGLPVTYCVGLVPPVEVKKYDGGTEAWNSVVVPAPSIDGTFSSSSNCTSYYGKDAVSGAYMEYSVGMGINALIFDQPMPQYGDAKPLGDATVEEAVQEDLPGTNGKMNPAPLDTGTGN